MAINKALIIDGIVTTIFAGSPCKDEAIIIHLIYGPVPVALLSGTGWEEYSYGEPFR